ncbi:MAG TPA: GNAT family N-acetyltransferase [Candidatus Dormibacteraeota bacterium]|jgi:RimJ/RimL family protein N-acetyltransferase
MPDTTFDLELRPAMLDDARLVADLETARDPSEPADPARRVHWWRMTDELEKGMRQVAIRKGEAVAYTSATHELWDVDEQHFGTIRTMLRPEIWSEGAYRYLVQVAEDWLRSEGAIVSVARIREDFTRELAAVQSFGYREVRRMRTSELDLMQNRDRLLAARAACRRQMREQGVSMLVLSEDPDPDKLHQLYLMVIESEKDIPTTVPWRELSFDEWKTFWFTNPMIREDWFWIAREGDVIVGTSVLDLPVERGMPWTAYTGTSRSVRGRGIARALKYESICQALEAGYSTVRTSNDSDNPPILRINAEMGYRLIAPVVELHRQL